MKAGQRANQSNGHSVNNAHITMLTENPPNSSLSNQLVGKMQLSTAMKLAIIVGQ